MKDLTFTQEFFLCALRPKGSTALTNSIKSSTCLLSGMLLELSMGGYIEIDGENKVQIKNKTLSEQTYLTSLYHFIQKNKPMKVVKIAEKYAFDFKKPEELFRLVGYSLVKGGYVAEEKGKGLLRNKVRFIPDAMEVSKVVEKIRAEFLEQGVLTDEVVILGVLLYKCGLIKKYFSKYEVQKLRKRLKEVMQSDAGIFVKKLVDDIDTWFVIICSSGAGI